MTAEDLTDKEREIKFIEFMRAKRIKKNDNGEYEKRVTHTVMSGMQAKQFWGGSFHISGKEYNTFIKLYKSVIDIMKLHIVERPNEIGKMVGPYIVDIDYKTKSSERHYKKRHIEKIIKICNNIFSKYLDVNDARLKSYVLEKNEPSYEEKNGKIHYKDGFHIFYDLPISCNKRLFFFDKIKEKIASEDIFSDIEHMSSYDEIVDESVIIDNGVLMFGSCKEGREPYKLTCVYDKEMNEEPIEEYSDKDDLINLFALQQYNDDDDIEFIEKYEKIERELNEKNKEDRKKKNKQNKQISDIMQNSNTQQNKNAEIDSKYAGKNIKYCYELDAIPENFGQLFEFIDMMSVKRATEYNSWTRVGWALHGLSKKLYKLFLYFSKKAQNYNEESCYNIWREANKSGAKISLSTIKFWAQEDNPKKFDEIYNTRLRKLSEKLNSHDEIADFIFELYGDFYRCVNITKKLWYEFQEHRWVPVDSGYSLHNKISNDMTKKLLEIQICLMSEMAKNSGHKQDDLSKQLKQFTDTMKKLKDENYVKTLMSACARKFYDGKFEESLDADECLLGFENGIFDLREGVFRDGKQDDRVTMSTGYDYIEYNENSKTVTEIFDFIKKIQSKDKIREYMLRLFSSCLDGKNRDQMFHMFTGSGGNGKSKLMDLLILSLGKYAGNLSSSVLTIKDKDANGATPELASAVGKRLLIIQEPPADSFIRTEKIKILTGGDKVVARALYGNNFEYTPQYKIIMVSNKLPEIPEKGNDGGTWRRILATPFISRFIKDKSKVNHAKDIYFADTSLDNEKMKEWAPAFIWVLLNIYYPKYTMSKDNGGGLQIPEEVYMRTEKYKKDSDIYLEFINDNYIMTNDESDKEPIKCMYEQFKFWHKDNYNNGQKIPLKELRNNIEGFPNLRVDGNNVLGIKAKTTLEGDNEKD
jgi:P4 family phage/plasmid primase-like protien